MHWMQMRRFRLTAATLMAAFMSVPEPSLMPKPTSAQGFSVRAAANRRGRPRKFSRPARAITLTLPEDTIAALRGIDRDLRPRHGPRGCNLSRQEPPRLPAELAEFGGQGCDRRDAKPRAHRAHGCRTGADDGRPRPARVRRDESPCSSSSCVSWMRWPMRRSTTSDRGTFDRARQHPRRDAAQRRAQMGQRNIIVFQGLDGGPANRHGLSAPRSGANRSPPVT